MASQWRERMCTECSEAKQATKNKMGLDKCRIFSKTLHKVINLSLLKHIRIPILHAQSYMRIHTHIKSTQHLLRQNTAAMAVYFDYSTLGMLCYQLHMDISLIFCHRNYIFYFYWTSGYLQLVSCFILRFA